MRDSSTIQLMGKTVNYLFENKSLLRSTDLLSDTKALITSILSKKILADDFFKGRIVKKITTAEALKFQYPKEFTALQNSYTETGNKLFTPGQISPSLSNFLDIVKEKQNPFVNTPIFELIDIRSEMYRQLNNQFIAEVSTPANIYLSISIRDFISGLTQTGEDAALIKKIITVYSLAYKMVSTINDVVKQDASKTLTEQELVSDASSYATALIALAEMLRTESGLTYAQFLTGYTKSLSGLRKYAYSGARFSNVPIFVTNYYNVIAVKENLPLLEDHAMSAYTRAFSSYSCRQRVTFESIAPEAIVSVPIQPGIPEEVDLSRSISLCMDLLGIKSSKQEPVSFVSKLAEASSEPKKAPTKRPVLSVSSEPPAVILTPSASTSAPVVLRPH